MSYRVRAGHYYCIRNDEHALVETGEISETGEFLSDHDIDRGNPAASIPTTLEGGVGPML